MALGSSMAAIILTGSPQFGYESNGDVELQGVSPHLTIRAADTEYSK